MCQQCLDAVNRYWPDLSKEDCASLLWCCTAFPFADPDTVTRQVREMAEKSGRDLGKAMMIADEEVTEAMGQAAEEAKG